MRTELITNAELDAPLNELAALRGLEPDKLLHFLAMKWTVKGLGEELAHERYYARMNGAKRKAFDCEAEAARQRKAYTPIDWGAVDRPAPTRYAPIEWPTSATAQGDV